MNDAFITCPSGHAAVVPTLKRRLGAARRVMNDASITCPSGHVAVVPTLKRRLGAARRVMNDASITCPSGHAAGGAERRLEPPNHATRHE
jgi:hypothetical protein